MSKWGIRLLTACFLAKPVFDQTVFAVTSFVQLEAVKVMENIAATTFRF